MFDVALDCSLMDFSHIIMMYQASKKTDFTAQLMWWGLLRFAPNNRIWCFNFHTANHTALFCMGASKIYIIILIKYTSILAAY